MAHQIIDTHCHLTVDELYEQHDRLITEATEAGVSRFVAVVCAPSELDRGFDLARRFGGVRLSTGVHPHDAVRLDSDQQQRITESWSRPEVVACGEMGLDYHYDFSPRDVQQSVFRRQLDTAAEHGLPIVIHCREAHEDTVRILLEHGYRGKRVVFHCFSGTPEEAGELRDNGWWTSFTGIITFKKSQPQQEALAQTPLDQLMFETDCPYLSPEPVRRMRPNEPKNIIHTVRFAAMLRGDTFEHLAETSTRNATAFFSLDV